MADWMITEDDDEPLYAVVRAARELIEANDDERATRQLTASHPWKPSNQKKRDLAYRRLVRADAALRAAIGALDDPTPPEAAS